MALTSPDTVVEALLSELQDSAHLSYVPDANIVQRLKRADLPGPYEMYAVTVSLKEMPKPENQIGGWVHQTFTYNIVLWVKFYGATQGELAGGYKTDKGINAFIGDVITTLIQSDLGGVLRTATTPVLGGDIIAAEEGQVIAASATLVYEAKTKDTLT
jgi:hypothetical protein